MPHHGHSRFLLQVYIPLRIKALRTKKMLKASTVPICVFRKIKNTFNLTTL